MGIRASNNWAGHWKDNNKKEKRGERQPDLSRRDGLVRWETSIARLDACLKCTKGRNSFKANGLEWTGKMTEIPSATFKQLLSKEFTVFFLPFSPPDWKDDDLASMLSLDQLQVFSPSFIITGRTCVHRSRGYSSSSSASSYLLLFFFCFSLKESDGIHHHRYRRRRHRRSLSLSFRSAPVIRSFERQETGASKKRRRRNVESSSPNLISFFLSSCLYIKWSVQLVRLYRVDSICILYRLISFLLTAFPRLLGRTREDVHYEKKKNERGEKMQIREKWRPGRVWTHALARISCPYVANKRNEGKNNFNRQFYSLSPSNKYFSM